MTLDEIKSALECCKQPDECSRCPYDGNIFCQEQLSWEALDYIKQLESDLQLLKNDYQHSKSIAEETVERNKRLRGKLMKTLSDLKTAKTEAIREFSEKLRTRMQDLARLDNNGLPLFLVSEKFIDEIVEEMVGEIK